MSELRETQVAARSKMYLNSAREAYERGKMRAHGVPQLPAYPGDGSTVCLTNCRCAWRIEEQRDEEGNLLGWNCYWEIIGPDDANCPDCLDRMGRWNPYVVPYGMQEGGPGSGHHGHVGRPGKVGGSAPGAKGGGGGAYDHLYDDGISRLDRRDFDKLLASVPQEHLKGLKRVTTAPPSGYHLTGERLINDKTGRAVNGVYVTSASAIHVSPRAIRNGRTFYHELGHHKTRHSGGWKDGLSKMLKGWRKDKSYDDILPDMGLRKYSTTSGTEFLADAYTVWLNGSKTQWGNLRTQIELELGPNWDLDRLFGARG